MGSGSDGTDDPDAPTGTTDTALADVLTRLQVAVQSVPAGRGPEADRVREEQTRALRLLEGYALPRAQPGPAPLVVVIGGPTGAGKSTLINSLVGSRVSLSGLMRPTTREPIMVHHPVDAPALRRLGLLADDGPGGAGDPGAAPSAPRAGRTVADADQGMRPHPVAHADMVPGLVLVDSPDLDSRLESNRRFAERMLDLADLWMFVTTGTDYADALSWEALHRAAERQISVAVVLNRLRESEIKTVRGHLAMLLRDAGLARAYMFVVPEVRLDQDLVPLRVLSTLEGWLARQARDGGSRQDHLSRARAGSLDQVLASVHRLADAVDDDVVAVRRRRVDLEGVFSMARETVRRRCTDGSLVTADLVRAWSGPGPDGAGAAGRGRRGLLRGRAQAPDGPAWPARVHAALAEAASDLAREQLDQAVFRARERSGPAPEPNRSTTAPDLEERIATAVRVWSNRVHRHTHGEDADTSRAPGDPVTLAVATLGVLPRAGTPGGGGPDGDAPQVEPGDLDRVRESALAQLETAGRADRATALALDAGLDLVAALTVVVNQEELRQLEAARGTPVPAEAAGGLRDLAEELRGRRAAGAGRAG